MREYKRHQKHQTRDRETAEGDQVVERLKTGREVQHGRPDQGRENKESKRQKRECADANIGEGFKPQQPPRPGVPDVVARRVNTLVLHLDFGQLDSDVVSRPLIIKISEHLDLVARRISISTARTPCFRPMKQGTLQPSSNGSPLRWINYAAVRFSQSSSQFWLRL
jgi:hypothetical protein